MESPSPAGMGGFKSFVSETSDEDEGENSEDDEGKRPVWAATGHGRRGGR